MRPIVRHVGMLLLLAGLAACLPALAGADDTAPAPPKPVEKLEGVTAIVEKLTADGLVVSRAGTTTDRTLPAVVRFKGGPQVKVSGRGKNRWLDLRRGDLVLVSYVKGDPLEARKVNVLPRKQDRMIAAAAGIATKPKERSFVGYIKSKEGDELHVMKPAPANSKAPPEIKRFIRRDGTTVEVLRESWDELRKGDRVKIAFQKGNPRPMDTIQVIWRGGEKPLPAGVATRLFDPAYDRSVKDVDGIGETGPVPVAPKRAPTRHKIKLPRER